MLDQKWELCRTNTHTHTYMHNGYICPKFFNLDNYSVKTRGSNFVVRRRLERIKKFELWNTKNKTAFNILSYKRRTKPQEYQAVSCPEEPETININRAGVFLVRFLFIRSLTQWNWILASLFIRWSPKIFCFNGNSILCLQLLTLSW